MAPPTAATLLADGTRGTYVLAANHTTPATTGVTLTRTQLGTVTGTSGDNVNLDGRGWVGRPNGGRHGLDWQASHTYTVGDLVEPITANGFAYKCTTAGTSASTEGTWTTTVGGTKTSGTAVFTNIGATSSSQPTILEIGTFGGGSNPTLLAIIGSLPSTPYDQVMRIEGLERNNTANLFPLDPYLWPWQWRKNGSGYTGPNLDEHPLRVSAADPGTGDWRALVDGVWFKNLNDACGIAAGAGPVYFRNCVFESVGDDCVEADFANSAAVFDNCLFLNVFMGYSATGSADRSTSQHTIFQNCVIVLNRLPHKNATQEDSTCIGKSLSDMLASTGWYWGHQGVYKQPGGANMPRLEFHDTQIFMPGMALGCAGPTGFSGSGFLVSVTNTSLRFGRGGSFHAGDGTIYPAVSQFPVDWDTTNSYSGAVTIINDSVTWETQKDAAVNAWLADPAHPQFVEAAPSANLARRTLTNATATANAAQTITATPTGMQTGDWLYAMFSSVGGTVTHAAPTGWTQVGTTAFSSGLGVSVWRINVQPGVAGPFTFDNGAGVNRRLALAFEAWSGGHATAPIVGTPQTATATNVTSLTHPSQDSGGSGRVWMLVTAKTTGLGLTSTLNTPAGFTEDFDLCTTHATLSNDNVGLHRKTVGVGATGTQAVTSIGSGNPDATNQTYAGVSFLMAPAGSAQVVTATAAGTQTWGGVAAGQVITSAPVATGTAATTLVGGGFQNVGCFAPLGVGHNWYAAAYGDVFGTHISTDGITWRPSNKGIGGPHDSIRTLRGSSIEGSATVANRLWGWSGQTPDGTGGGNLIRGTYDTASGFVTWSNYAQTTQGPAGGTTGYGHPREVGRLLALDEANDTLYGAGINGIARIQGLTSAPTVTNARALAGEDITGMMLDPTNPQIMWAVVRSTSANPGVYRIANIRSGTVTATRYATLTDPQDLTLVDTGTTRYLFVAARGQGVRRWTVSADITTGWTDVTSNLNTGGTGNGPAGIDAIWDGGQIQVLVVNAGNSNLTNGGAYTRGATSATPTWTNESTSWTVTDTPWGMTGAWWLSVLIPGLMLDGTGYDSGCARIDPSNPNVAMLVGRSGIWRSQNGWQTWRPAVAGTVGVMSWVVAARPGTGNQALEGNGDWSLEKSTDFATSMPNPVRPRPGGGMGLMWTADGATAAWACGDPFAGASEAGVFTSTDGGTTWDDEGLPVGIDAHGVAIGYTTGGSQVLLTVYRTGIYRKVGTGSWSVVSTLTVPQDSQAHNQHFCWPGNTNTTRRQHVYCTGHNGLLWSDNAGATWQTIHAKTNTSESAGSIAYDPDAPDTLYYTVDNGVTADTGLWKITSASSGASTATKIGPSMTAPGPCAVDPNSGVVYVCTTGLQSGGAKLYVSPANNPGAATTFADITDTQWSHGPWAPCDMSVTANGQILVSNRQGGLFLATRAGTAGVVTATANITTQSHLDATGTVITATAGIVTAAAAIATTSGLAGSPDVVSGGVVVTTRAGFNGTWWPRLVIRALLGGVWTTMTSGADLRSFTRSLGRDTQIDSANPGAATIVLGNRSGAYDPANTSAFGGHPLTIGTPIQVLAERPLGTTWPKFTGTIRKFGLDAQSFDPTMTLVCADGLERLGRTPTPSELHTFTSTTAGPRIGQLADLAAWDAAARSLDTGVSRIPVAMVLGDSVLELMRKVEQTEMGLLWVNEAGTLVFYDRHRVSLATRSTTVQVALADTSGPGQLGMVELYMDRSTDHVYNDIHITRDADPAQDSEVTGVEPADEPTEQIAQDLASIGTGGSNYGYLNLPADVGKLHSSDAAALEQAQGLLGWFSNAQDRIEQVEINALHPRVKNEGLWDRLLGLTLLDRISVLRDYGPRTISGQLLVQAITEEVAVSPPTWLMTLTTSNPPPTPDRFVVGTSRIGTDRIGW